MTTIREAATDIGYHDELSVDLEYSWEEERPNQEQPCGVSKRWHTRSTDHAVEGLLFGPRVDATDRQETVEQAVTILQRSRDGDYDRPEVDFDAWEKTEVETAPETRTLDLDAPEDAEITARRIEEDDGMKNMDAASYCAQVVGRYINEQIDNGLWREKPHEVADILERTGDDFLAEAVETYARQPKLTVGSNVYTEHVAPDEADTPEEYLNGLEKDYFQPI